MCGIHIQIYIRTLHYITVSLFASLLIADKIWVSTEISGFGKLNSKAMIGAHMQYIYT